MADAFHDTSLTDLVKTGYDQLAFFALRPQMRFALTAATRRRPVALTNRGTTITFTGYDDLAAATTALTEDADVTAVATTTATKSVTLNEYGNVAKSTAKLRGASFLDQPGIDPAIADLIGFNAAISYDTLARNALVAGTNVEYAGTATSRTTINTDENISAAKVRKVVAKMRGANARGFGDMGVDMECFAGFAHPDTLVDLRQETGDAGWLVPTNQLDAAGRNSRWYGRVGLFEGVMWIETPRAPLFVNASNNAGSTGNIDVYATIICGREALSMAYSSVEHGPEPSFVVGPITDTLRRFHTFGWKWFGGFGRFRDLEELYRIESASTIGSNAS